MGRFERFLGKVSIKVDNEVIDLKRVTVEDVQKLVNLSKVKEDEISNGVKVLTDILHRNMPEEPREELEAFVLRNYSIIAEELVIALGWTTREKIDKEKQALIEKKNNSE